MVIVDTGFWVALANESDRYYSKVKKILLGLHTGLITTWPVIAETCHILLTRVGVDAALLFIQSYNQNAFQVFELSQKHGPDLLRLMKKYQDLPMDLADASLVILAEHLGSGDILTTDFRDFQTYRLKNHKPFKNLLLDETE